MVNKEFFDALTQLVAEKGIDRDVFLETLQNALTSAYKKQFEGGAEISVVLDAETYTVDFCATRYVVEEVTDKDKEISLEEAQELDPAHQVGDTIVKSFIPKDFGRIAAQTAKQVILQKFHSLPSYLFKSFTAECKWAISCSNSISQMRLIYLSLSSFNIE